jgi:DUF4097 and DUF4098 domain-containing protein YvlB
METQEYDIEIVAGVTFKLSFSLKDANGVMNLSGYSAKMQIRKTRTSESVLAELSTTNGKITLNAPNTGDLELKLPEAETRNLDKKLSPDGKALYDLKLTDASGDSFLLLQGDVIIRRAITQ